MTLTWDDYKALCNIASVFRQIGDHLNSRKRTLTGIILVIPCFGCGVREATWPPAAVCKTFCSKSCAAFTAGCLAAEFAFCKVHNQWWDRTVYTTCPKCPRRPRPVVAVFHDEAIFDEENESTDEVEAYRNTQTERRAR